MQNIQKKINYCRLSLHGGMPNRMELSAEDKLIGSGGGYFSYLAPVFDTMDYNSSFHRFTLNGSFRECKYEILAAAVNTDISDSLLKEGITPMEQVSLLQQFGHVRKVNKDDFLLHELEGRYLWIYIGVTSSSLTGSFTIDSFQVEFPKSSFVEYLPEIYQETEDTFFERYMAALQSLYVDLEAEVSKLPNYLDYETTPEDKLAELAGWVGLDKQDYPYSPEQLRYMLAHLWELQAGKGTCGVMRRVLEMVTGRQTRIVEYFKWKDWMGDGSSLVEEFSKLYGKDAHVFTVIIDFTGERTSQIPDREMVLQQIEEYTPMGLHCNLVYLTESYHMDTHCYLDVNSYLSTPVEADTSGFVLGGNYVLG